MDYSDKTLINLFTKGGVFSKDSVKIIFAKDQSKDIKLCYLLDSSGHDIDLLVRWLDSLDEELLRLQEFKKEIKWFNSHKKMEVASRVFNRKLGQPFVDKDFIEAYFFAGFSTIYEKRDLLKLIKSRYASFVHDEKKDKKQLNVYVDMKVFENFTEIHENNAFSKSQLIQFLFDPKHKGEIQKLIDNFKSTSFALS